MAPIAAGAEVTTKAITLAQKRAPRRAANPARGSHARSAARAASSTVTATRRTRSTVVMTSDYAPERRPCISCKGSDISFPRTRQRHRLPIGRPRLDALQIFENIRVRLEVVVQEIAQCGERKHHHHVGSGELATGEPRAARDLTIDESEHPVHPLAH